MTPQELNEFQELVVDQELRIREWSGGLFAYKELGRAPAPGGKLSDVLGPIWDETVRQLCREALEKGRTGNFIYEGRHDGSRISLDIEAAPKVENEHIFGVVLTIRDVTVARRFEQHQVLRERMKIVGRLATQIVHSMNNPIAAVLNSLGGLLMEDFTRMEPKRLQQELKAVQEQIYQIALVTNSLAAFAGNSEQNFKLIQPNRIVENTVHLMRLLYASKPIDYRLECAEDLPRILGNEVTLEQALINICRNAVEAMNYEGVLTITTGKDPQFTDFINITVSDTGNAIPESERMAVFEPFYTTKEGHQGLGLTVCYGIISSHNGNIEITANSDKGTAVIISLPIAKI
ncbi:MAG: ATP-binding protein [candidate division KSB1 bacterium]|nr:ATP-binding protein [candidate division KSB1 bacterium]MDZ7346352.1 ATP-binding protein [candidate division KSB1 bacterium]